MATISENNGDASANTGTAYTISLGDIFEGTLDPAEDKDWIKVELTAGTIYDFTLSGVDSAEFALFDSSGHHIVRGGITPTGGKLIFSPDVTATYYIQAGSFDDAFSGDYELSLVENTIPVGSYDEIADYLTDGYWEWLDGSRAAFLVGPGGTLTANISVLTEEGRQLARWAFEAWTSVTGISFEFVEDNHADIIFKSEPDNTATGGPTAIRNGLIISSGVNIPPDYLDLYGTTIDSYSFSTFVHEIGHALGLGHSGPYPTDFDNPVATYGIENVFLIDSWQASIMSYINQYGNTYIDASLAQYVTPMIADIIAIQNLYGVPDSINVGDTIYGYQSNLDGYLGEFFRLWTGESDPFIDVDMMSDTGYPTIKSRLIDLDSDGDPDLVVGNNTGLLYYFENIGTSAVPGFSERTGTDNPLGGISVGSYSTPTFTDLDGDGDSDLIVGNGKGNIAYFENTDTAASPDFTQGTGAANPFDGITMGSLSTLALADLDGDGDLDLAVGIDNGDLRYYENTGTSANPDFIQRTGETNPLHNINAGSYATPEFVDVDNDDDFDLVIGSGREGIYYFENTGTATSPGFIQRTGNDNPFSGLAVGAFFALDFVDLDGDSSFDIIIGNHVGNIVYFKNTGTHTDPEFSPQNLTNPTTFTIYDNGGNDTLDLRTDTKDQQVYLRPEGISDVYGLTGNLVIARDTVIENFVAGSGNDLIAGNAVANYLKGNDGDDRIWGGGGNDILEGGAGADRLDGGAGMDWVSYRGSDAAVTVNLIDSAVSGGHADGDVLTEIENVIGSDYDDVLVGNDGANQLAGGAGMDWVSYRDSNAAVTVNLAENTVRGGHAEGDVLTEIENVIGSDYDDVLVGNDEANRLAGGAGADRLEGGAGTDWVSYRDSDAAVTVNLADNTVRGGHAEGDVLAEIENVIGSDYDDVLVGNDEANWLVGGAGADRLEGGAGTDWVSYRGSDAAVTVNLTDFTVSGGHAEGDVLAEIENVVGSDYDDVLVGNDEANRLVGGAGADRLEGGGGADQLEGGAGIDWLSYAGSDGPVSVRLYDGYAARGHAEGDIISGFENLRGSAHADVLAGSGRANRLEGGAGDDRLIGGSGNDLLEGGAGADRLEGGAGIDWLSYAGSDGPVSVRLYDGYAARGHAEGDAISGFENLRGSIYADRLAGTGRANRLEGGAGDDRLIGGSGDDVLEGGVGADRLDGGPGIDTALYQNSDVGVTVYLYGFTEGEGGHAEGDVLADVENVTGSDYDDHLEGDDAANRLTGGNGDDLLYGSNGNDDLRGNDGRDYLEGGAGADRLDGGSGNNTAVYKNSDAGVFIDLQYGIVEKGHAEGDVLINIENVTGSDYRDNLRGDESANRLQGGAGDDYLRGGDGADRLDGGDGIDLIFYWGSDEGVTVNLEEGTGKGGHAEGDVIVDVERVQGSDYRDVLIGDNGENVLQGLDGNDELQGGNGNDWLEGSAGADRLDGGSGSDTASYQFSDAGVAVNLKNGTSEGGHAEGDVIVNVENIGGSDHDDLLSGDEEANILRGYDGDDELRGNSGDDWLYGNAGDDRLDGGGGADRLYGDEGNDTFIFGNGHGHDRILDFTNDEDQIDLSALNLSGFDELTITSISDSVEIDLTEHGGGTILLQNFDMADLDAMDFLF